MPIVSTDIKYSLSGGSSNASPAASLGGGRSSNEAGSDIFDNVTSAEAAAGDTEYRCLYLLNNHGTLSLQSAKVWVQVNTPNANTTIEIGLGTSAINGVEQSVANENTAPTGVTFSAAPDEANALSIGDLSAGAAKAIWIKRIVSAGAAASTDGFTLRVKGDTLP